MRTNFAGFVLTLGMGLIVLLIGFVALSTAGLVGTGSNSIALATGEPTDTIATNQPGRDTTMLQPVAPATLASLVWRTPTEGGDAVAIASGDALFKNNCTQCHAVNEKVVGPALAGLVNRRHIGWIIPWVRNSAKVIASGDDYAVKLFTDNSKQQMPAFPNLSDKDIKDIVLWVSSQEGTNIVTTSVSVATR